LRFSSGRSSALDDRIDQSELRGGGTTLPRTYNLVFSGTDDSLKAIQIPDNRRSELSGARQRLRLDHLLPTVSVDELQGSIVAASEDLDIGRIRLASQNLSRPILGGRDFDVGAAV